MAVKKIWLLNPNENLFTFFFLFRLHSIDCPNTAQFLTVPILPNTFIHLPLHRVALLAQISQIHKLYPTIKRNNEFIYGPRRHPHKDRICGTSARMQ